ncbi:MAG TPA: glycosyltransferase family 4 protein, partial [Thermoanaerobaculia bacterium]|nr:glycosyltransferase family 4 protein [Thermoanaerobaculia bacterium]
MHILHLPSWYSTSDKPWRGMFVRDQALALSAAGVQVGVAFVERRSLSRFTGLNLTVSHFQTEARDEDDVPTIRMKGWSTFAQTVTGSLLWSRLMRRLVESYALVYGVPDLIHGHAALWGG